MRDEQEFFDTLKKTTHFEPRQAFVDATKNQLIQKARKLEYKRKVKKISFVSSGITAAAFLLVWISFFGGKEFIFETAASLFQEETSEIVVEDPPVMELSENGEQAKLFLEGKDYRMLSYEGSLESYELTKEKLVEMPYMHNWGLQPDGPDEYLGNTIETEIFIVENHPLDQLGANKTRVYVFLVDGEAFGGVSSPITEEVLVHFGAVFFGAVYSLDGKTLEELRGIDYETWQNNWVKKYGEVDEESKLLGKTERVFGLLKELQWVELAEHVHPELGLFFSFYADAGSPYSHEVGFTKAELNELVGTERYVWGYDMGDYEFEFSVNEYVEKFLLGGSQRWDGLNTREVNYEVITFNESAFHSGGIINTIPEYFPNALYVEYYSPPPSEELGHLWQALRFIYEEYGGQWYLIGIARDVHSP